MAQYEEISIDQGSDVTVRITLEDNDGSKKDLTGYTASAQLRRTINTSDSDAVSFTTAFPTPRTDGLLDISLTNTQTDALEQGRYFYDVEISHFDSDSDQIIERILEGQVHVSPSITRV